MPPKDYPKAKKAKKEKKTTTTTAGSGGGWGYFDSIAAASNQNNTKEQQKKAVDRANRIASSQGWDKKDSQGNNLHQQAMTNANTIYGGGQTQGQIEAEKQAKIAKVVTTTDGDGKKKKDEENILKKIFVGDEIKRLTPAQLARAKQILSEYIALGVTNPLKLRSIMMSSIGGSIFGKDQTYSDMEGNIIDPEDVKTIEGPAGKPVLVDKDGNPVRLTREGTMDLMGRDTLKSLKMHNPELYYPFAGMPQTSGGIADLAGNKTIDTEGMDRKTKEYKDAVKYNKMIFDARESASRDRAEQRAMGNVWQGGERYYGPSGGGGGGGGGGGTTDPADPGAGMMPSGTYLASQFNKNLGLTGVDPYQNQLYMGGPEQNYLAGGYWDPNKQEWVGQGPWGTQNLWQGANPTTAMAEGGPVRAPSSKVTIGGGGLFDFKPYGF